MQIIWFDHLFFIIVGLVLPLLALLTETQSNKEQAIAQNDQNESQPIIDQADKKHLYYSNGLTLVIGAMITMTLWNVTNRSFGLLGFQMPKFDDLVIYLCGAIILIYTADTAYNYFSKQDKNELKKLAEIMPSKWSDYSHFIFLAFCAGICEEIIFRGFLVNYINHLFKGQSYSYIIALVVPALVFSISHLYQGWISVLKIFTISILFGAIFLYSNSLYLVMIIHTLVDLVSGAMMVKVINKA